jgi:hypothetical protein
VLELISDEAIPELGIVAVDLDDRVGEVRVGPVAGRDRVGPPLVNAWAEKPSTPQVNRTGIPSAARSQTSGNII